jgi:hypothetical protein
MATVGSGVEATKSFAKNHWAALAVVAVVVVILALAYEHKNQGKLTAMFAGWPLVGKLFA